MNLSTNAGNAACGSTPVRPARRTRERFARVWLAAEGCACVAGGVMIAFDLYPVSVMTSRLREVSDYYVFDLCALAAPRAFGRDFGLALAMWGASALGAARWPDPTRLALLGLASCLGADWLVRSASPLWTELAVAVSALFTVTVAIPIVVMASVARSPCGPSPTGRGGLGASGLARKGTV